jgi:hypothetical protein
VPLASPVQPPGFRLLILGFHTCNSLVDQLPMHELAA